MIRHLPALLLLLSLLMVGCVDNPKGLEATYSVIKEIKEAPCELLYDGDNTLYLNGSAIVSYSCWSNGTKYTIVVEKNNTNAWIRERRP